MYIHINKHGLIQITIFMGDIHIDSYGACQEGEDQCDVTRRRTFTLGFGEVLSEKSVLRLRFGRWIEAIKQSRRRAFSSSRRSSGGNRSRWKRAPCAPLCLLPQWGLLLRSLSWFSLIFLVSPNTQESLDLFPPLLSLLPFMISSRPLVVNTIYLS